MRKIKTPYGASNGEGDNPGGGAALRYAQGYKAAMDRVVKIAGDCNWSGADFTQAFCDEMTRIGIDLGPDPEPAPAEPGNWAKLDAAARGELVSDHVDIIAEYWRD